MGPTSTGPKLSAKMPMVHSTANSLSCDLQPLMRPPACTATALAKGGGASKPAPKASRAESVVKVISCLWRLLAASPASMHTGQIHIRGAASLQAIDRMAHVSRGGTRRAPLMRMHRARKAGYSRSLQHKAVMKRRNVCQGLTLCRIAFARKVVPRLQHERQRVPAEHQATLQHLPDDTHRHHEVLRLRVAMRKALPLRQDCLQPSRCHCVLPHAGARFRKRRMEVPPLLLEAPPQLLEARSLTLGCRTAPAVSVSQPVARLPRPMPAVDAAVAFPVRGIHRHTGTS